MSPPSDKTTAERVREAARNCEKWAQNPQHRGMDYYAVYYEILTGLTDSLERELAEAKAECELLKEELAAERNPAHDDCRNVQEQLSDQLRVEQAECERLRDICGNKSDEDTLKWQARAEAAENCNMRLLAILGDIDGAVRTLSTVREDVRRVLNEKDNELARPAAAPQPITERTVKVDTSWMDSDAPQPTTEGACECGAICNLCAGKSRPTPTPEPPAVRIGHDYKCTYRNGKEPCDPQMCDHAAVVALVGAARRSRDGLLTVNAAHELTKAESKVLTWLGDALAALDKGE